MKARALYRLFVFLLLGSLYMDAAAQYQLVLEKPAALKRQRIYTGDEISIRVKGMDQMFAGELQGVKATHMYVFGDSIPPDSLDRIYIGRNRSLTTMVRTSLIMAAVLYPVMMVINLPRDQWTWQKGAQVAGVSATALVLQRVLKVFHWKRIHLDKGKWRLRILPTVESL
jgi:hypothetical protein